MHDDVMVIFFHRYLYLYFLFRSLPVMHREMRHRVTHRHRFVLHANLCTYRGTRTCRSTNTATCVLDGHRRAAHECAISYRVN